MGRKRIKGKIRKEQSEIESNTYQLDLILPGMVNPTSREMIQPKSRPREIVHVTAQDLSKWESAWGWVGALRGKNTPVTYRPPPSPDPSPLED